jgi:hypothetical protein
MLMMRRRRLARYELMEAVRSSKAERALLFQCVPPPRRPGEEGAAAIYSRPLYEQEAAAGTIQRWVRGRQVRRDRVAVTFSLRQRLARAERHVAELTREVLALRDSGAGGQPGKAPAAEVAAQAGAAKPVETAVG